MSSIALEKGYLLAEIFVKYLSGNNKELLLEKFDINSDIYDEIIEILNDYYDTIPNLSILPYEEAIDAFRDKKYRYDFFEFNDANSWGLDCNLLVNGKIDEPIIHFKITKSYEEYNLEYLYIGS